MAMSIVVQKYGGSSVADVERLQRVAQRVTAAAAGGRQVVVVVSAMGDTTDELLGLARQVAPVPPRRELDMLLSAGERIAMSLLSMAISRLGYQAISFTGSQCGIITNDRHSGARILEVRPYRIQDELDRGRIVIVAGFQGVSYKREITTLGRGGSDTTAVALAAALGAEYCEICSDVDGVFSGDPRLVDAPRLLQAISYDQMQELAEHGARVLNPQAVEFARRAGIAVYARATRGEGPGTRVDASGGQVVGAVGVTGARDWVRLRLRDGGAPGRMAGLLELLGGSGIALKRLWCDDAEMVTAVFACEDLPDFTAICERLASTYGSALGLETEIGSVSVVGEGLGASPRSLLKALQVAESEGISVLGSDSSPLRMTLLVPARHVESLQRSLHRVFIEQPLPSAAFPAVGAGALSSVAG